MNIGLIGSGGREHALCKKIYESKLVNKIFCFPGNPGTSKLAQNIDVDILNFKSILKLIKIHKIDLVVVGPEEPLVRGIVDFLEKNKINVFGPNKFASRLEGSKAFMKKICKIWKIPTANFKICKNKFQVLKFLQNTNLPIVVKADGLAAGKGVTICSTKQDVIKISNEIFNGKFKSSKKLVLEEFLEGEEASYFVIVDKYNTKFFGTAQDHKRVGENDTGPNTGGMGAYSPAPIINKILQEKIEKKIIKPTLRAIRKKGSYYKGFLYVGLMIKKNEPYLIEFNIRMGDPECQVIMPRLKTDLVKIINYSIKNKLNKIKIKWFNKKSMTVVLCSKGYPGNYKKNKIIQRLNSLKLDKDSFVYHAGTKLYDNKLFSAGGRVLNITATGIKFILIRKKIIKILNKLNWKNGFFRRDIGQKVIES